MSDEKKLTAEQIAEYEANLEMLNSNEVSLFNPDAGIPRYVRGADRKMYRKIPASGGEYDYLEADAAQAYHELPDGEFIAVRDTQEAMERRAAGSHVQYFEGLAKDPRTARRAMKRQDQLQRQFEQLAIDRALPPTGPKVEMVTDEKFMDLRQQWIKAKEHGNERDCDFQPLTTYQHKLVTKSGNVIRPLYQGEVGMRGDVVVCLEPGYGVGSSVQVKGNVE